MSTLELPWSAPSGFSLAAVLREAMRRQRALTLFALGMLGLSLLPLLGMVFDDRSLRGVGLWAKPLKFMASTALFALTTAWLMGLLPEAVRRSTVNRGIAWLVILTSSFEVLYITVQAALGSASHHNVADPFHALMFGLMALAAVVLTGTQAVLAWQIARHSTTRPYPVTTWAVMAALLLTFVLSTVSGFMLGALQPPPGVGLPIVGWHLAGGDVRPAHFLAVHAQQFIPLAGLALQRLPSTYAGLGLAMFITAYLAAWAQLAALGLGWLA